MDYGYAEDLAYIHDVGYGSHALNSAPGIVDRLTQNHIRDGLIVELGCGSGLSALAFTNAGYRVLGIDLSEAMIAMARRRVPHAEFRVESLFHAQIPPCQAVTSIGECFNYRFDPSSDRQTLGQLFQRIYNALASGGLFIFDIAEPGQIVPGQKTQSFTEGQDWVVLIEKEEDPVQETLTRRIITFRQVNDTYRRDEETHCVQLYRATDLAEELSQIGFHVQTMNHYGDYALRTAHTVLVAHKP